jgi:hypothetical protein
MKKHILKTSLLLLLLNFLIFQPIIVNTFVENAPLHTLEIKAEKEKDFKEDFCYIYSSLASSFIDTELHIIKNNEQIYSFIFNGTLFRPPIA